MYFMALSFFPLEVLLRGPSTNASGGEAEYFFGESPSPGRRSARKISLVLPKECLPFLNFWVGQIQCRFFFKAKVIGGNKNHAEPLCPPVNTHLQDSCYTDTFQDGWIYLFMTANIGFNGLGLIFEITD